MNQINNIHRIKVSELNKKAQQKDHQKLNIQLKEIKFIFKNKMMNRVHQYLMIYHIMLILIIVKIIKCKDYNNKAVDLYHNKIIYRVDHQFRIN